MFKKIRRKIEEHRNSNGLFWMVLVILKDILLKVFANKKSAMRIWFNKKLKEIAPKFQGAIINIGCGSDKDGEGRMYKDYFVNAEKYIKLEPYTDEADYKSTKEIKDNSFDVVLNFWVLEHVWDIFSFVKELYRISKKYLVISVPIKFKYHPCPNDYWRFTKESITRLLDKKFKIIEIYKFDDNEREGGFLVIAEKMH